MTPLDYEPPSTSQGFPSGKEAPGLAVKDRAALLLQVIHWEQQQCAQPLGFPAQADLTDNRRTKGLVSWPMYFMSTDVVVV